MELYIYEDYKDMFPEAGGRELTDMLIIHTLKEMGIRVDKVLRTEKGKPYVQRADCAFRAQWEGDVYISVSHSGAYFACLVSREPVGVDIQQHRRVKALKISRRYFTREETRYIEKNGEEGFFFIWARKEAYCKYTGRGMEEILKGTPVLGRGDVKFVDFQLEKGVYCSCCTVT